jgi:hypothetical protein
MSRFKIGQKVVSVWDQTEGYFKKGDIFTVDGFSVCAGCGTPCVYLKELRLFLGYRHDVCGTLVKAPTRTHFREIRFAPLHQHGEAISYKLEVSIPELTEIKEYQNQ